MSIETGEQGLSEIDKEFKAPQDTEVQNSSHEPHEADKNKNPYKEYLIKSGNPGLEQMKREATIESNMERAKGGYLTNSERIQAYDQAREEVPHDLIQTLNDLEAGSKMIINNSGDIKVDVKHFFELTGQDKMISRVNNGESPVKLLKELKDELDRIIDTAPINPTTKQWLYTAIRTRDEIDLRLVRESLT